ncbi:MAG TPA: 16S rRNA (cytosine(967)-C(5))-methyltransferase RsmB [Pseudomonadales bacterium]|nr:16S rRNA (cytosine(967)-C(5))-methyltransferase RsmB [Pseudomonadales bacterium]
MSGKNPRQIALRVLQARQPSGEFTEILLEKALEPSKTTISGPDRSLCQELVYGVVRQQAALDWLISKKTDSRQQNPGIQNLLRLGLYQIFWLDRIPPHAAVHETVELAKREGFGPKAGFINAILRGYLREFEATKKMLADLKVSNPALGYSYPQWLFEKWRQRFGDERTRQLMEWNNTPPRIFARVNTLKTDAGQLLEKWRAEGVEYEFTRLNFLAALENTVFELKIHPPLASLESFQNGWFYIQDPSTLLAPLELSPKAGETILDLCAAPGGKTTFIAQQITNDGKIVASDVAEDRLKLIQENCQRLGLTCVETIAVHALAGTARFDRILIDAPCSNTGVLRRRVDLRWRVSPEEILRLQKTQSELLAQAAPMLKPGGTLVYSTCSLEPEENTAVIREFLKAHPAFKMERERELLPFSDNVDGAFVALLRSPQ